MNRATIIARDFVQLPADLCRLQEDVRVLLDGRREFGSITF